MAAKSVIEIVREYARLIRGRYPVRKILLFGSFALGTERPGSDIDVAIVMETEPANVWQTEADLFRLAREIDFRIEPVLIDDKNDRSGFWEGISSYGKVVE